MTELEKKAEKRCSELAENNCEYKTFWLDGYEQGQKDFDTDVTKLLNSYGVTFIDTNSIGGLIALHQLILDMEKENEELKQQIKKMKCCENCKHYNSTDRHFWYPCEMDLYYKADCKKWELAE